MGSISKHTILQSFSVNKTDRERLLNQKGLVVWFAGLSGSGKTTLANGLEEKLHRLAFKTYVLDGDNLRNGLCNDLDFSVTDRTENIRRVGEVAKLMMDAGMIVLSAFVSPFEKDREMVRNLIGPQNFVSVFVDCPLAVCEQRDTKGLYKKARSGQIESFTGINSPFEIPVVTDLQLKTAQHDKETLIADLFNYISPKIELV